MIDILFLLTWRLACICYPYISVIHWRCFPPKGFWCRVGYGSRNYENNVHLYVYDFAELFMSTVMQRKNEQHQRLRSSWKISYHTCLPWAKHRCCLICTHSTVCNIKGIASRCFIMIKIDHIRSYTNDCHISDNICKWIFLIKNVTFWNKVLMNVCSKWSN